MKFSSSLRGEEITIYGNGKQTRSFCYVDDLIEGIIHFMDTEHGNTGPINLGNPHEITILELAETILNLTGSKSKLIFNDLPSDDPMRRRPDISKAKDLLSWKPKTTLEKGLTETIKYFEKVLK